MYVLRRAVVAGLRQRDDRARGRRCGISGGRRERSEREKRV